MKQIFVLGLFILLLKPIHSRAAIIAPHQYVRNIIQEKNSLKIKKIKITKGQQILLEKFFPDYPQRINYQRKQSKLYKSAIAKMKEAKKFSRLSFQQSLTFEEQDALNYFNGDGPYKKHQDPATPPNLFDTRNSFLTKMRNKEMRQKFLKYYNENKHTFKKYYESKKDDDE